MSDINFTKSFLHQLDINFALMNALLILVEKTNLEGNDDIKQQIQDMADANGKLLEIARGLVTTAVKTK